MKTIKFSIAILLLIFATLFAQRDVDEKRSVNSEARIEIGNVSGSIDVIAWDQNEVEITGRLEEDVEELEISGSESRLKIKVRIPKYGHHRHSSAFLTVHVPRACNLSVNGVSADVSVEGLKSRRLEAESVSGRVMVDAEAESMTCESVSGRVKVKGKADELDVSSVSGSVLVDGGFKKIDGGTVSGRIEVVAEGIENGDLGTTSGSIIFDGNVVGRGRFNFKSVSGSLELILPKNISADFDISTFSGRIENHLTNDRPDRKDFGSGSDLEFTTGSGDIRISASSFSGSVDISRR